MIIAFPLTIEQRMMRLFEQLERLEYRPARWFWR